METSEGNASAQGMMQDLGMGMRASSCNHPSAAQLGQLAVSMSNRLSMS